MYNTKDWESMFDYDTVIAHEGGGATGPSGSGAGTKAAASSKTGTSAPESGFGASTFGVLMLF